MTTPIVTESLLTAAEMQAAEAYTIAQGTAAAVLMERAGAAVAHCIVSHYRPSPAVVVCGMGNNGGDGFVIARVLRTKGWNVRCVLLGDAPPRSAEARDAWQHWQESGGVTEPWSEDALHGADLLVDAVFGLGLNKPPGGIFATAIEAMNDSGAPIVSVDFPSGVDADSGAVHGVAVRAQRTLTFLRPKLGHVLHPGAAHCGVLEVADIGITPPPSWTPSHSLNQPSLWRERLPKLSAEHHKYMRGQALVWGGTREMTGAARLAAMAALRCGAGLARILCQPDTLDYYASRQTSVMSRAVNSPAELAEILADPRPYACLIGPGAGHGATTHDALEAMLATRRPCVIDADGLRVLGASAALRQQLHTQCVLTPHEGEFAALGTFTGSMPQRARAAAEQLGAVVVLKGSDSIIAQPSGITAINDHAPAWLATAGSGDVLAGIICGAMAQGMSAFDAACAGVWMHSEAARMFGIGLIADDIIDTLPRVLAELNQ